MALTATQQSFLRTLGAAHHNQGTNDPAGTGTAPGQPEGGLYQIGNRLFNTKVAGWRESMCTTIGQA